MKYPNQTNNGYSTWGCVAVPQREAVPTMYKTTSPKSSVESSKSAYIWYVLNRYLPEFNTHEYMFWGTKRNMASGNYGRRLKPYRRLWKPIWVKGVRQSVVITKNPSIIDQNQQLLVRFPNLDAHDVIVPVMVRLAFTIALNSTDANRTVTQNLGRVIMKKQRSRFRATMWCRLATGTCSIPACSNTLARWGVNIWTSSTALTKMNILANFIYSLMYQRHKRDLLTNRMSLDKWWYFYHVLHTEILFEAFQTHIHTVRSD